MDKQAEIILKKQEERRILAGHLWVFSNEIDTSKTPLKSFTPGQQVLLKTASGRPLATAYINPHSLISARIMSHKKSLDVTLWLKKRINSALQLRESIFDQPYYRLVYGEGDGFPGLIIDRFADVFVVQITTAGMEKLKEQLTEILVAQFSPVAILYRNNIQIRVLENLSLYDEVAYGELPEVIDIKENNCLYRVPLLAGQKTGWFYDQRFTRWQSMKYIKNKSVLDLFSYSGSFGVLAAQNGAKSVVCVDSSQLALDSVQENARLNKLDSIVATEKGDCAKVVETLVNQGKEYDVVLIDPPAFIKKKRDFKRGLEAYRAQNHAAMQAVKSGGFLISSSCSQHLPRQVLQKTLLQCARSLKYQIQIVEQGGQGADHPIHPAIPETEYLKTLFCRIIK